MSYNFRGHNITRGHMLAILTDVRVKGCIDSQTFLSMRGTLNSGRGDDIVGNFLVNCSFIHDAMEDENGKVLVVSRTPAKFVLERIVAPVYSPFDDEMEEHESIA